MPEDPNLSRRDLLRGRLLGRIVQSAAKGIQRVDAAVSSAAVARETPADGKPVGAPGVGRRFALPIHRPPGAVDEVTFLSGCTRCNECISACPVGAIVHAPARFREAADSGRPDPR